MERQQSIMEAQQKLEIFISCRSLADVDTFSKSDPFCSFFVKKLENWVEIGRTEVIMNNLNPNFAQSIIIDYFFELQQYLKIEVHHFVSKNSSNLIGSCETTLAAIAGAKDQVQVLDIQKTNKQSQGKVILRADQVKTCNDQIQMVICAEKVQDTRFFFWHSTNPFVRLYRMRRDSDSPMLVYESEPNMNQLNPVWDKVDIKAQKLCNGDYAMPIKAELWDYRKNGSHLYLGECSFAVQDLTNQERLKKRIPIKDKKQKVVGSLYFREFKLKERYSFMDYLMEGIQLNLVVAIDFTASNQNPQHPSSLHYQDPQGRMNQYQQAISSVGDILINYDYDQQVPVYGFGCKPRLPNLNSNNTLHCFPINGNLQGPEVNGLKGILDTYRNFVNNCQFDGPTYFAPLLNETMKIAIQCRDLGSENYFILLILTDGEIHDVQQTIDAIVASSHLPLSIIIIGIGNADFTNMEKLDNDDLQMCDSSGRKAKRDLVQFVPFNQYKDSPSLLAKNVLEELPDQLVEYFELIGRKPNVHKNVDINNIVMIQQQMNDQQYQQQQQFQQQLIQQQQQPQYQQQQPQRLGIQALGQGMAQGGFLSSHIKQAQNYNYPK